MPSKGEREKEILDFFPSVLKTAIKEERINS